MYIGFHTVEGGGRDIKPSEATSEVLNIKHFLGEHTPTHPQEQCASHDQYFPFPNKKPW